MNAGHYNRQGGWMAISLENGGSHMRVVVQDGGVGVAPEHLPHLFERFYRVDAAASGNKGTGLGLAIVRALVEQQGGTITCTSEPGVGSTFTVLLPPSEAIIPLRTACREASTPHPVAALAMGSRARHPHSDGRTVLARSKLGSTSTFGFVM